MGPRITVGPISLHIHTRKDTHNSQTGTHYMIFNKKKAIFLSLYKYLLSNDGLSISLISVIWIHYIQKKKSDIGNTQTHTQQGTPNFYLKYQPYFLERQQVHCNVGTTRITHCQTLPSRTGNACVASCVLRLRFTPCFNLASRL